MVFAAFIIRFPMLFNSVQLFDGYKKFSLTSQPKSKDEIYIQINPLSIIREFSIADMLNRTKNSRSVILTSEFCIVKVAATFENIVLDILILECKLYFQKLKIVSVEKWNVKEKEILSAVKQQLKMNDHNLPFSIFEDNIDNSLKIDYCSTTYTCVIADL